MHVGRGNQNTFPETWIKYQILSRLPWSLREWDISHKRHIQDGGWFQISSATVNNYLCDI